jgi:hypothetical protein
MAGTSPAMTLFVSLVKMADQIDAAADHQHGGHGPQNQDWHCVILLS